MFILNMRMMAGDSFLSIEKSVLFFKKAQKMLQDAKGNKVGVSVFGINYVANTKNSGIDVTLDLKIWCSPAFDNMKLVEKLGRSISDMKL